MTTTYYAPPGWPAEPSSPRPTRDGDVRYTLGPVLPDGYAWTRRPTLTVITGGDPTAPGQDELRVRARMIAAIRRWGARA
ncbi:hypothetical protein ACFCV8_00925 [Streptomyces sp. NPDC056347]|uniref:hypothetical protein n=1 Tax=Streptomyces sp. NPDC056347 TaxID=3345790 RepID=UPI0035D706C1